jgi:spoIIIJ-associated protein
MNNIYTEKIKKEVELFFEKMKITIKEINIVVDDGMFFVSVYVDDPKTLIGERGQTLLEVQHLLRILIKKRAQEDILLELDLNDYKKKKREALREIAKDIADEVSFYKKEKTLPPMNSYERKVIHVALKEREDVQTESSGESPERRVIVKPV